MNILKGKNRRYKRKFWSSKKGSYKQSWYRIRDNVTGISVNSPVGKNEAERTLKSMIDSNNLGCMKELNFFLKELS